MSKHILSLEAPDTMNKCILRLVDTSIYADGLPIECATLEVTPPGFQVAKVFNESNGLEPLFISNITACDLNLQSSDCGTSYSDLPDGIYIIKYSVSPNEYVYAEYNHLRITDALHKVQEVLCELDLGACEPDEKIIEKLNKVTKIRRYLDAAKAKVEFCHEPLNGINLYRYAVKLLNDMLCLSCSTSSCRTI